MAVYLKGDVVTTKSGETGTVLDMWGICESWHKIKTDERKLIFVTSRDIASLVSRPSKKKRIWGR